MEIDQLDRSYRESFHHWRLLTDRLAAVGGAVASKNQADRAEQEYRARRDALAEPLYRDAILARHELHARIEALAYRLWEESGRENGHAEEHWYRAEALLRSGATTS